MAPGEGLWFRVPAWGAWLPPSPQRCLHPPCSCPGSAHPQFHPEPLARPFVPAPGQGCRPSGAVPAATRAVQHWEPSSPEVWVTPAPGSPPSCHAQWRPCCRAPCAGSWWAAVPCAVHTRPGAQAAAAVVAGCPPRYIPRGSTQPLLKHLCRRVSGEPGCATLTRHPGPGTELPRSPWPCPALAVAPLPAWRLSPAPGVAVAEHRAGGCFPSLHPSLCPSVCPWEVIQQQEEVSCRWCAKQCRVLWEFSPVWGSGHPHAAHMPWPWKPPPRSPLSPAAPWGAGAGRRPRWPWCNATEML